jgi:hypothetical protein
LQDPLHQADLSDHIRYGWQKLSRSHCFLATIWIPVYILAGFNGLPISLVCLLFPLPENRVAATLASYKVWSNYIFAVLLIWEWLVIVTELVTPVHIVWTEDYWQM